MKSSEYISRHHVFTTSALMGAMDSPSSSTEQLRLATKAGTVEQVRRGLLVSNYSRFEDRPLDPLAVMAALDERAVASYHSALEIHRVAHNVGFSLQIRSDVSMRPFTFRA